MIGSLFNLILVNPLTHLLFFIFRVIPDFGMAIIILTLLIRIILYPLNQKSIESQKKMSILQPRIKKLQNKYQGDKVKQGEEIMKLYQEERISPFSGFAIMLVQLPILFALYRIFRQVDGTFLGIFELSERSLLLAVIAGLVQFWQMKEMSKDQDKKVKPLTYSMPIITVIFGYSFPAGLPLYWIANTLFMVAQQRLLNKKNERNNQSSASYS